MSNITDSLEEQCEDAVFKLCCTRERYSVRCANELEKYLQLSTKQHIAKVQTESVSDFEKPLITEEQEKLFHKLPSEFEIHKTTSKSDVKIILNKLKELENIVKQIERSKSSEMHQLLKE